MISCCDGVGAVFSKTKQSVSFEENKGQLIAKYKTKEIEVLLSAQLCISALHDHLSKTVLPFKGQV